MMRYLLVLSLLPLPLLAFKESTPAPGDFQLTAKPVGKDAAGKGVYYSLPENYYVVALPVLSKTFTPGPFCGLAGEFFSISWLADDFFK